MLGCLLRGIDKEAVERGQVLCKPGSVSRTRRFKAEAYILTICRDDDSRSRGHRSAS